MAHGKHVRKAIAYRQYVRKAMGSMFGGMDEQKIFECTDGKFSDGRETFRRHLTFSAEYFVGQVFRSATLQVVL